MNELVILNRNERPTTTSLLIAEKFGKRHDNVLQAIGNLDCSEQFSRLNFQARDYKKRGKVCPFCEITRDGFSFLAMGFTGKESAKWKEAYIKQFNHIESTLQQIAIERQSSQWNMARIDGKMQRRNFTDILVQFQAYALDQGSKGTAANAYSNFTSLINKAMGLEAGQRDLLTDEALRWVSYLEGLLGNKIKALITQGTYCKDIYQSCKTLLHNFVKLAPYAGTTYLPKPAMTKLEAA